jgi:hypothetical protein
MGTGNEAGRTTYRERRMARADRLDEWSGTNATKAAAAYAGAKQIADQIPFGQPILVGHHSERGHRRDIARIDSGMQRSVETGRKAERQASSADEIRAQADRAIYSDDPDAIERLQEKLAGMEAERERMKAENAAFRKEHKALLKGKTAYERSCAVPFPSYSITNLGGRITAARQRIEMLQREKVQGPRDRMITARFSSSCETCGADLEKGSMIRYNRQQGARCATCPTEEA